MESILQRLQNGEILAADGGMATMLFERGCKPGDCPDAYNITHPEIVEEIARLYFEAGAEILQTNTFGSSTLKLAEYDLEDRIEEINEKAVAFVRKAVSGGAYISGSCGPTGKVLEPYGDASPEAVYASFEPQMRGLINGGVDLICVETMMCLREASLAIKAAKSISSDIPVMATMVFNKGPKGFYTLMGDDVAAAAAGLQEAGADIVGSNCNNGIEIMVEIGREYKKHTALPIIIQPNAGIPELRDLETHYPETPEFFAEHLGDMIDAGVSIIGGCCGTNPDHIRVIRQAIDSR